MNKEPTFQELCEQAKQRELAYNKEMDEIIHAEEKAYIKHIREEALKVKP
jgi:predicted patatin/cPLA2 family phospholipase